jgi:parallel beta-helix repeat protein
MVLSLIQIPMNPAEAGETPFPSILIHSDDEFTPANGVFNGSGTASDPYIIEDLLITGPYGRCIEIRNTTKHLLVRNVTCTKGSGASMGISVGNATNCTFEDVVVYDQAYGIIAWESENITIRDCTISTGNLKFRDSEHVAVYNTSVTDVDPKYFKWGIEVDRTNNCTIVDCRVINATQYGLYVHASNDLVAINNTLEQFDRYGIYISRWSAAGVGYDLIGNNISDCRYGFMLEELTDVRVINNTIRDIVMAGIFSRTSTFINLSGNEMERGGILMEVDDPSQGIMECQGNTISGRPIVYVSNASGKVIHTDAAQVFLVNLTDCKLVNYTNPAALTPVYVFYCNNVTLSNLSLTDGVRGITVLGGEGVSIKTSSLANYTDKGISASLTTDLTISDSTFTDSWHCIEIMDSDDVDVIGNTFTNSIRGVMGDDDSPTWETHENWTIANNSFAHLDNAIRVYDLVNGTVKNNVVDNCSRSAIQVLDPNSELLVEGNIISNSSWWGIGVGPSVSSRIVNNTVQDSDGGCIGISSLDDGLVLGNVLKRAGGLGMWISTATNSTIVGNIISDCQDYALRIDGSGNRFYLNTFISNSKGEPGPNPDQVLDVGTNELWDDGKRGNFWSDYRAKYPAASNDGLVWDTPYLIFTSSPSLLYDRYPLAIEPDIERPVARAGEDVVVDEGTALTLDSSASTDDKGIVSFRWSFQYGGRRVDLRSSNPEFEFGIPGVYNIALNVSDAFGNWDVDILVVTVLDILAPTAVAGRDQTVDQRTTVTLDGGASYDSGGIVNHTWSVEMGGETILLYGAIVDLHCDHAGTFTVTLTVTDNSNRTGTDTLVLTVRDIEPPVPVVPETIETTLEEVVVLEASASTDNVGVTEFEWIFELDGITHTLTGPTHQLTFFAPATFTIRLTLKDAAGNNATTYLDIVVRDVNAPEFKPGWGSLTFRTPDRTIALNSSHWHDDDPRFPEGANFTWQMIGEGETHVSYGHNMSFLLTFKYGASNTYLVNFTAVDPSGNSGSLKIELTVIWEPVDPEPPTVSVPEDFEMQLGETVNLTATFTRGDSPGVFIGWDVEDHISMSVQSQEWIEFTPDTWGTWHLTFFAEGWWGTRATASVDITVPRPPSPPPTVSVYTDLSGPLSGELRICGTAESQFHSVGSIEFRVDGGEWQEAGWNNQDLWMFKLDTTVLENGDHTLEIRAGDGESYGGPEPITINVQNPTDNGNGGGDDDGGTVVYIILGVIIAIVVGSLLYFIVRKR